MSAPANDNSSVQFFYSYSVESVLKKLGGDPVSATAVIRQILDQHPEYINAKEISIPRTSELKGVKEWLGIAESMFEVNAIAGFDNQLSADNSGIRQVKFHGRLFLLGLVLSEPELYYFFQNGGYVEDVIRSLKEPFKQILSSYGRSQYQKFQKEDSSTMLNWSDSVPNWPDDPLRTHEDDILGRGAFARFLAKRIQVVPVDSGAYAIHLVGPWGSGKTSLLNLLRVSLEGEDQSQYSWLVIDFNAWRHQHIRPPWWSLMEAVYNNSKSKLNLKQRLQEFWWRFNTGRLPFVVAVVLLIVIISIVIFPKMSESEDETMVKISNYAQYISPILALVATIWGGIVTSSKSLLFGSSSAAQHYSELVKDPTNTIKKRFSDLVLKLQRQDYRVTIFIDDLDRCQSEYVIELLEGIQTLFRDAPVVFVIAADRQWIHACYEEVYEKFKPKIHEPGKSLGSLFLEKAFRFSTPMPGMSKPLMESYWNYLLKTTGYNPKNDGLDSRARNELRREVSEAETEYDVNKKVEETRGRSFLESRALREEAVVRLAAPSVQNRMENTLRPYVHLLDPNPRSMKLLVNCYSSNRALAILAEIDIKLHQLALWTVLSSRWPDLAELLKNSPNLIAEIGKAEGNGVPERFEKLFHEKSLVDVVKGVLGGSEDSQPLQPETIRKCALMSA